MSTPPMELSSLATLRHDLKDALEGQGLRVEAFLPERIQPPIVTISAGNPYVEQGLTNCLFKVTLVVTLIAAKATNEKATDALDEMIESAILGTGDWFIDSVGEPFRLDYNNAQYLSVQVTLNQEIEIGG